MRSLIALITVVASLLAGASGVSAGSISAHSNRPENLVLRWRTGEIKIGISSSLFAQNSNIKRDSDIRGAIDRSLRRWESVSGIRFVTEIVERASVSPSGVTGDGINLITTAGTAENVVMFGKGRENDAARTRIFYNKTGAITEADIVLSPFEQFSTDGSFGSFDLEAVLTHEIGHMLGLEHTFVAGSVMSEVKAKNGILGIQMLAPRILSDSDIAAVRSLYSLSPESICCAAIKGKIKDRDQKTLAGAQVWVEDRDTGKLVAYGETLADGSYRIGGLPIGDYDVLARRSPDIGRTVRTNHDLVATISLDDIDVVVPDHVLSAETASVFATHLGLAGNLADSPIVLSRGGEYSLLIGGVGLDERSVIAFSSPLLQIEGMPRFREDLSGKVSVVAVNVTVDDNISPGTYSLYLSSDDGESSFAGAIVIE